MIINFLIIIQGKGYEKKRKSFSASACHGSDSKQRTGNGSGGRGHKTPGWNDERTAVLKRNRRKLQGLEFRVLCLLMTAHMAGCDARWNTSGDGGGLDTIVSRSTDKGKTWHYTFANYLGDNGNTHNNNSTTFIDPAMATDGEKSVHDCRSFSGRICAE